MIKSISFATIAFALLFSQPLAASDVNSGGKAYRTYCAKCHGPGGNSVMAGAPDLNRPGSLSQSDQGLLVRIQSGKNACPGFRGILSEQKIFDVIAFIRTLSF
ncbi:MAG: c-type cytochrome [Gammaproteobacteria bacterium]|jgi:mono/diheme cytochrome c family protein|nr:c-type cytochrome [Gammaproteobacteria bacterium]